MQRFLTAVVLVGHGSGRPGANQHLASLSSILAERVDNKRISYAFLELGSPTLPDAIEQSVQAGATRVTVLPFFLSPGLHTSEHIPKLVLDAAKLHPQCDITLGRVLGESEGIIDLLEILIRPELEEK